MAETHTAEEIFDEGQAAKVLGIARKTLQAWRLQGRGPQHIAYSSRSIRYRRADLEEFIEQRRVGSSAVIAA